MTQIKNSKKLFHELKILLPNSSGRERFKWAQTIVQQEIDLVRLAGLLEDEYQVSSRFLWLLSEIGLLDPEKLHDFLPTVLKKIRQTNHKNVEASLAKFWLLSGVPPQNESEAITLLFTWIQSNQVNVTGKSRSMQVLYKLSKKYPELTTELKSCLEYQVDKHSTNYQKKVKNLLVQIG